MTDAQDLRVWTQQQMDEKQAEIDRLRAGIAAAVAELRGPLPDDTPGLMRRLRSLLGEQHSAAPKPRRRMRPNPKAMGVEAGLPHTVEHDLDLTCANWGWDCDPVEAHDE